MEKQERAQCLILRGCSDVLVRREITQKGAHLLGAHFFGVTFPMEQDEALNPVHVYLFRAQRIMLKTDRIADTVELLLKKGVRADLNSDPLENPVHQAALLAWLGLCPLRGLNRPSATGRYRFRK